MTEVHLKKDVVDAAVREVYQDFRVALSGVVGTFARRTSRAVVRLMVRFTGMDMKPHEEPDVPDAPVIYPSGGGYGFWFDLAENDPCVVLCQDGPPYGFYETGSAVSDRTGQSHTFGCAVAFPGGRVSNSDSPTDPPNASGEAVLGGGDLSAALTFRRAGGPSPAELGTTVVHAANPTAGLRLGGDDAVLGVVRVGDPSAASTEMNTVLSALVAAVNVLAPGTVTPPQLAAALAHIADASAGSVQVVSK